MKQQERSQETRSHILAAAEQSFAERGYDITSVDSICRAAGVSKGAFYHHFPSKGAVFAALLDEWLNNLDTQLAAMRASAASIPLQVAAMASSVDGIYRVAGAQWNILLEFWAKAKVDPAVARSSIEMLRRYQGYFRELLERGQREGSLHVADIDGASVLFLSVVLGLLLQGILDPEGQDWRTRMQQSLSMLMTMMAGRNV